VRPSEVRLGRPGPGITSGYTFSVAGIAEAAPRLKSFRRRKADISVVGAIVVVVKEDRAFVRRLCLCL
jgi:hypothetical protein